VEKRACGGVEKGTCQEERWAASLLIQGARQHNEGKGAEKTSRTKKGKANSVPPENQVKNFSILNQGGPVEPEPGKDMHPKEKEECTSDVQRRKEKARIEQRP